MTKKLVDFGQQVFLFLIIDNILCARRKSLKKKNVLILNNLQKTAVCDKIFLSDISNLKIKNLRFENQTNLKIRNLGIRNCRFKNPKFGN